MKGEQTHDAKDPAGERRRFLGLLGAVGTLGLAIAFLRRRQRPQELSLKEADFYRDHDLAG